MERFFIMQLCVHKANGADPWVLFAQTCLYLKNLWYQMLYMIILRERTSYGTSLEEIILSR